MVIHSFHGYHWIYWIGPGLGAIVAAGFYKFIKVLEYETANPGQDSAEVTIQRKAARILAQAVLKENGAVGSTGGPLMGSKSWPFNLVAAVTGRPVVERDTT